MGKSKKVGGSSPDTGSMIEVFKGFTENPLIRRILRGISKFCKFDRENRLEVALQIYTGQRKHACPWCKIASKVISPILKLGSSSFGVTTEEIKQKFSDPYWRRGLANIIRGLALFGVQKPFIPGAPFQIVWNVTRKCNLKCKHCYENAGRADPDELTTEEALKVIDKLADAGVVILAFSGGEPTIRKDILKLIHHAHSRGMYVACATNALTFSNRDIVKKFKRAGLEFAQISLDGLDPKTHDEFRGVKGAFEKTVQGIKNCVAEGLFVEVATTATHYNYKEIPELIKFVDKLGADWFMVYNFVPTGRGVDIINQDLTPEEREELLQTLWDALNDPQIKVNCLSTAPQFARIAQEDVQRKMGVSMSGVNGQCEEVVVPTHFYNPSFSGKLKNLASFIGGCGAGRFYMAIEPNGDLYPCVFFPHEKAVKVGNIKRDDFTELWVKSRVLLESRNKDILKDNCGSCEFRYTCGGCRARAYNYFKDLTAPDPGCIRNKEYWEKLKAKLSTEFEKEIVGPDILLKKIEQKTSV
ncbi:MAG: radical SAM protein [Candidatus Odinarchaeia archaeon]